MQQPATPVPQSRRPRVKTVIAALLFFEAGSVMVTPILLIVAWFLFFRVWVADTERGLLGFMYILGILATIMAFGGSLIAAGIGLLRGRRWAWGLAMTLQWIGIATSLFVGYSVGEPWYPLLVVCGWVILLLVGPDASPPFGHTPRPS